MSASVTEAAKANTELQPESGHIYVKGAESQAKMKAGRWNPVGCTSISFICSITDSMSRTSRRL